LTNKLVPKLFSWSLNGCGVELLPVPGRAEVQKEYERSTFSLKQEPEHETNFLV